MLLIVLLVAALCGPSDANFKCACNMNHPEIAIMECPSSRGKVIGYMYENDQNNPFHAISVDSDPTCKPIAHAVKPLQQWTAIAHFGQVGFIHKDWGLVNHICTGDFNDTNDNIQLAVYQTPDEKDREGPPKPPDSARISRLWSLHLATSLQIAKCPTAISTNAPDTPSSTNHVSETAPPTNHVSETAPPFNHVSETAPPTNHVSVTDTHVSETPIPTNYVSVPQESEAPNLMPLTDKPFSETLPPTDTMLRTEEPVIDTPYPPTEAEDPCDKIKMIMDLSQHKNVHHHSASRCASGNFESEAVVMAYCHAPPVLQWRPGLKVIDNCQTIPRYSPISLFAGNTHIGKSAIFLSCNNHGEITLLRQSCDKPLTTQTVTEEAFLYHVIQW